MMFRRTWRQVACCFALAALATGCSEDTGIVIQIEKGALDSAPEALEIFVGVDDHASIYLTELSGCYDLSSRFIDDGAEADRRVDVKNRDLSGDPYRLLLRPGQDLGVDETVMVMAVAWQGDTVTGAATLDAPVGFVDGKVVQWDLVLEPADGSFGVGNGCACASTTAIGQVVIASPDNLDCDPAPAATDCNDEESAMYPGATEICDGLDNNCVQGDEVVTQETPCLADAGNGCFVGTSQCDETAGNAEPTLGECTPASIDTNIASPAMCQAYEDCAGASDAFGCALDKVFTTYECTLIVGPDGPCPERTIRLGEASAPLPTDLCEWVLMGGVQQANYWAALVSLVDAQIVLGSTAGICQPLFTLRDMFDTTNTEAQDFYLWQSVNGAPGEHAKLHVHVEPADVCPALTERAGFSCVGLRNAPLDAAGN